jgi:hypothetical protein
MREFEMIARYMQDRIVRLSGYREAMLKRR